ncbi:MAG: hypothetical protein A2284_08070 [Deltaproteobacteria bacterium RIFOXYA12_FULL_61_11]|nr:MAG: hypothetical protein A2284_08070 [Deltaproteobacteria bacterium RIFOXYA12_FULL_61_11]
MLLSNWNNYPSVEARVLEPHGPEEAARLLHHEPHLIARGMGRCYGDASLAPVVCSTLGLDKFLTFDEQSGVLHCEAGVTLDRIIEVFLPRGWFPSVVPGTRQVTVGGAIASDIHGKNHHLEGTFCRHLRELTLLLPDGTLCTCSPQHDAELFWATCGGMGLTGLILSAAFPLQRVPSAFVEETTLRVPNLTAMMEAFEEHHNTPFSVAWIDCLAKGTSLGRGLVYLGRFARREELPRKLDPSDEGHGRGLNLPFTVPSFTLNPLTISAFNGLLYHKTPSRPHPSFTGFNPYFFPLDWLDNWNRLYGKRGFVQYQFVLPREQSQTGLHAILSTIASQGRASFLAILKLFGPPGPEAAAPLGFPREGYTLALDFPLAPGVLPFLEVLDGLVLRHQGRHYLTKDARMSRETFAAGYERAGAFLALKRRLDPHGRCSSLQSRRLGLG